MKVDRLSSTDLAGVVGSRNHVPQGWRTGVVCLIQICIHFLKSLIHTFYSQYLSKYWRCFWGFGFHFLWFQVKEIHHMLWIMITVYVMVDVPSLHCPNQLNPHICVETVLSPQSSVIDELRSTNCWRVRNWLVLHEHVLCSENVSMRCLFDHFMTQGALKEAVSPCFIAIDKTKQSWSGWYNLCFRNIIEAEFIYKASPET